MFLFSGFFPAEPIVTLARISGFTSPGVAPARALPHHPYFAHPAARRMPCF